MPQLGFGYWRLGQWWLVDEVLVWIVAVDGSGVLKFLVWISMKIIEIWYSGLVYTCLHNSDTDDKP